MNMISTGSFLTEMEASNKQQDLVRTLTRAWEKKNSKAARAGGVSLMALSLAACGSSDEDDGYVLDGTTYTTLTAVAESDNTAVMLSQADYDAAIATATTSDNTDVMLSQADYDAAIATATTSDNTDVMLSQADYDAAIATATTSDNTDVMMSQADYDAAIATATTSDNTDVMLSQADYDAAIDAADDAEQATIDGMNAQITGAGFADLSALVTAYDALANPPASSSTLTTGADTITGTANNDSIRAVVDSNTAANDTLNTADVIDLAGGTGDSMTIIFEVAAATAMPNTSISGVEIFNIQNVSGNALTMTLAAIEGETNLNNQMSTADVSFTNVAADTNLDITGNGVVTNANTAIGYVATATSATVDLIGGVTAGTVTVTGTGLLTETYTSTGAANTTGLITSAATTTDVNINATTNMTSTLTGTVIDTVTISGAGDVDLNGAALDATVTTVNASGATGDVDVQVGAVAEATDPGTVDIADVTVTGGSGDDDIDMSNVVTAREISVSAGAGDDTITIGTALVTSGAAIAGDVIDGGDGTDILSMASATANGHGAITTVSNMEEITISNALAHNFTVSNFQAGLNTVNLNGGTGTLTMEAGANTVNLLAPLAGGALGVTDTGTATTDSVTIVNEDAAANAFGGQAITSTGFETVNLVTTGTGAATTQTVGAIGITADTGGTATLNISGSNILDATAGAITAQVVNASGLTAAAAGTTTFDMTGRALVGHTTAANTITGSDGDDVLVGDTDDTTNITGGGGADNITGGAAAETISGGDGNDTIAGGGGADTITGDAGDDQITLGGTTETVDGGAGNDTVIAAGNVTFGAALVGGDGTDTISMNAAVSAPNGSVVSGFETLTLATAGTTDLDNYGNNTFTTVTTGALGAQVIQSVRSEDITLTGIATGTVTVTMEDASGGGDSAAITLSGDANLTQTLDVIVANVETLNVTSTDTDDTTAHAHTVFLDADSATTINVSGNTALVIAAGSGDLADVTTMNASGLTLAAVTDAGVTYISDYTQVGGTATITGSNGVDSLTGNAANADVISGGAGADTIVYNGGSDTVTGGDGDDTFDIDALGTSAVHVTIADLTAGDILDIAGIDNGTATWNATAVTLGASATLANYLDAAAAGNGGTNSIARHFQFDGNTYIVNDNTAGATFAATDAIIEITGLVDLSNSTLAGTDLTIV